MDIEKLTKSQIILLTLFVSFVTSIATGIITVSLMQQAPKDVTRVIQRTVERTVEKVTPPEVKTKFITKEKTITISDADIVARAVQGTLPSIVRIYSDDDEKKYLSSGVVISSAGIILADAGKFSSDKDIEYNISTLSGNYKAKFLIKDKQYGLALLQIVNADKVPRPISIAKNKTKLASAVILISGKDKDLIDKGLVAELGKGFFKADINSKIITPGSILIDMSGNVVGINTSLISKKDKLFFVPARFAITLLSELKKKETPDTSATTTSTTTKADFSGATSSATDQTQKAAVEDALKNDSNKRQQP